MQDDLIERSRALAEEWFEMCDDIHIPLTEAADAGCADNARIAALEAENARLREALGDLIEAVQRRTADLGGYDGRFGLNKSIAKARAALGERQ